MKAPPFHYHHHHHHFSEGTRSGMLRWKYSCSIFIIWLQGLVAFQPIFGTHQKFFLQSASNDYLSSLAILPEDTRKIDDKSLTVSPEIAPNSLHSSHEKMAEKVREVEIVKFKHAPISYFSLDKLVSKGYRKNADIGSPMTQQENWLMRNPFHLDPGGVLEEDGLHFLSVQQPRFFSFYQVMAVLLIWTENKIILAQVIQLFFRKVGPEDGMCWKIFIRSGSSMIILTSRSLVVQ